MNLLLLLLGWLISFDGFGNAAFSYLKERNYNATWFFQAGRILRGVVGLVILVYAVW